MRRLIHQLLYATNVVITKESLREVITESGDLVLIDHQETVILLFTLYLEFYNYYGCVEEDSMMLYNRLMPERNQKTLWELFKTEYGLLTGQGVTMVDSA